MINCEWLPKLEPYDTNIEWKSYESKLYDIFVNDFIKSTPIYQNNKIAIRKHPIEMGKEEAFFHVTCQDYLKDGERVPDLRRCERIRWVRKFIENYNCKRNCEFCSGMKVWEKPYKNTVRIHILLEEERYMVVLEKREKYNLLITAFYIEHDHTMRKKLEEYEKYKI
ncbi:hypothetical protein [Clostridium isatidis]|uniref:hypothetical protein n=1 Tax=Clostridium isatidis TaxID=182773 RepID=UPI003AAFC6A5